MNNIGRRNGPDYVMIPIKIRVPGVYKIITKRYNFIKETFDDLGRIVNTSLVTFVKLKVTKVKEENRKWK